MDDELRFDGQCVVVTGAGRGLGFAYAELLARRGAFVVVNDIDASAAESACAAIVANGGSAIASDADVVGSSAAIVASALEATGRLDAIVNNAGVVSVQPFAECIESESRRAFDVHVWGTINLCRAAWDALGDAHGRIVNISSGSIFGMPAATTYASAKAAIFGLTRALAIDARERDVRVNAVLPMAYTRMYKLAGGVPGSAEETLMKEQLPPESVAPFVAVLVHPSVRCTGEAFEVAAGAASRIQFASGPSVVGSTPEAYAGRFDELFRDHLTPLPSLEHALTVKLTALASPNAIE